MIEVIGDKCLGTMKFGTSIPANESNRILDFYLFNGGNFIDTANNYAYWNGGNGNESESVIGKWCIKQKKRHEIVIATKIGAKPISLANQNLLEELSKKNIISAVENCLRRLKTDYIDIVYEHFDFEKYDFNDRLETFNQLIDAGKIRGIGICNVTHDRLNKATQLQNKYRHFYLFIQQKFSFFNPIDDQKQDIQKYLTIEMENTVRDLEDIQIMAYSVLLSGQLTKYRTLPIEYDSEYNRRKLKILKNVAANLGYTIPQLIYAWMLHKNPKVIPIVAASTIDQLRENLLAFDIKLDNNVLDQLNF